MGDGGDWGAVRLVNQDDVDTILAGIRKNIVDVERVMEKPYTEGDDRRYRKARTIINFCMSAAFTLAVIGVKEAKGLENIAYEHGMMLIDWRYGRIDED